jgi:hypothetical protein
MALEMQQKCLEIKRQSLGDSHVSVAKTKSNFEVAFQNTGDQPTASVYFKEAHDIFLRALGPDDPKTRVLPVARFG